MLPSPERERRQALGTRKEIPPDFAIEVKEAEFLSLIYLSQKVQTVNVSKDPSQVTGRGFDFVSSSELGLAASQLRESRLQALSTQHYIGPSRGMRSATNRKYPRKKYDINLKVDNTRRCDGTKDN